MPPDDPERSELDEALFGGDRDRPAPSPEPRPPDDEDLANLDSELFGESAARTTERESPPETGAKRRRRSRGKRFGLGVLVVLLVVGLGGVAFAVLGSEDTKTPAKARVEVRGSEVTRTTL